MQLSIQHYRRLAERARTAATQAHDLPSPCASVCTMDDRTGWCQGCLRTLDEIGDWSRVNDATKRMVWGRIARRIASFRQSPPFSAEQP